MEEQKITLLVPDVVSPSYTTWEWMVYDLLTIQLTGNLG